MKFSDGMEFNLQTKPHIETRSDGMYVVGGNMLIAVNDMEEANDVLSKFPDEVLSKFPEKDKEDDLNKEIT